MIRFRHDTYTFGRMWISQGKHTTTECYRFVQQIQIAMVKLLVDLKVQSTHCELDSLWI